MFRVDENTLDPCNQDVTICHGQKQLMHRYLIASNESDDFITCRRGVQETVTGSKSKYFFRSLLRVTVTLPDRCESVTSLTRAQLKTTCTDAGKSCCFQTLKLKYCVNTLCIIANIAFTVDYFLYSLNTVTGPYIYPYHAPLWETVRNHCQDQKRQRATT